MMSHEVIDYIIFESDSEMYKQCMDNENLRIGNWLWIFRPKRIYEIVYLDKKIKFILPFEWES